jgi:hypothetical protein
MEQIQPSQIATFLKRFRLRGGILRRFRVRNHSPRQSSAEILLTVGDAGSEQRGRLRLVLDGVEEYRFQRRPGPALVRLKDVRLGYFNGVFFLNLDAFPDDGPPAVIDFRASDAFIAARAISWEFLRRETDLAPT